MEMETAVIILTPMVGLFGVTSAVLGFIAEGKRLTPNDIRFSGRECVYPANSAHTLAVLAIILLVVAQIIASAAGRCCGCCRPAGDGGGGASKSTRRVVGVVFSVLSWVATVIAVVYYWQGATFNEPGAREATLVGSHYEKCYYFKAGGFVKAGVLSLIATSLGILSGVQLRRAAAAAAEPQAAVAVGLPQWPAQGYGQDHQEPNKFAPPQDQAHV